MCKLFFPIAVSPFIEPVNDVRKQQRITERANEMNAKYQKTVESSNGNGAESSQNKKVRNAMEIY